MTSSRGFPRGTCARPARTEPPPFRIAFTPGPGRIASSKRTRTAAGGVASTAPFAGGSRTRFACAEAGAGATSAATSAQATTRPIRILSIVEPYGPPTAVDASRFRNELESVDRSFQTDARAKPARPDDRRRQVGAFGHDFKKVSGTRW